MSAWWVLVGAVVVAVVLPHIPFANLVVRPLVWLSTLAHEAGHGMAAELMGGSFQSLHIYPDASGVARSSWDTTAPWRLGVVSIGGLIGPAVLAAFCLVAGVSARLSRVALFLLGAFFLYLLITVTEGFGSVIAASWGATLFIVAIGAPAQAARLIVLVLAVQMSLSVFNRADYLFVAEAVTGEGTSPSDVANVASAFGGSYLMWGVLIGLNSVALLVLGLVAFFTGDRVLQRWSERRQARQAKKPRA